MNMNIDEHKLGMSRPDNRFNRFKVRRKRFVFTSHAVVSCLFASFQFASIESFAAFTNAL